MKKYLLAVFCVVWLAGWAGADSQVGIGSGVVPDQGVILMVPQISAATTNAALVKSSGGSVCGWTIYNNSALVRYVKIYNKASSPTVGTDVPALIIGVPPTDHATVLPGSICLNFSTGIGIATTAGVAVTDTTAIGVQEVVINLFYK